MIAPEERRALAKRLADGGIEDAAFEAREIAKEAATPDEAKAMVQRRLAGEPLAYIFGKWEFYGLPFYVGKGVLIPRPDTELLVETALAELGDRPLAVADLCAGSGAVAVAVAKHSQATVTAVELDGTALKYLQKNIEANGVSVEVKQANVLTETFGTFDLILSNPPYIRSDVIETLAPDVKCEPRLALDGGEDGLGFYRRLTTAWRDRLKRGGKLMVEIGYDQAEAVAALFREAGFTAVCTRTDYGGNQRVIVGTYTAPKS